MKRLFLDFIHRGLSVSWIGPVVLSIIYFILGQSSLIVSLAATEVCIGIISITALAFIAGGMNVIYQIEQLPLMWAILIHGVILYISYLVTYLVNSWIEFSILPIIVFSIIFVVGYIVIWITVYSIVKSSTASINEKLVKNAANES